MEDVGESPLHDTRFQPGVSGNPAGRPKGSKRARSKMRGTLTKLYAIEEDAIELIRQEMTGKDKDGNKVDPPAKNKVDMAKFIVKAIESLNNTCLREEMAIMGVRDKNKENADELEANQAITEHATDSGMFSLDMPPTQH